MERLGALDAKGLDLLHAQVEPTQYNTPMPGLVSLYCVLSAEATDPNTPPTGISYAAMTGSVASCEAFTEVGREGRLRPGVVPAKATRQLIALMDGLQFSGLWTGT